WQRAVPLTSTAVNDAIAHYDRGVMYLAQGDLVAARADLDKAIELAPDAADSYGILGIIYRAHGDLSLARASFDKAIELNPKNGQFYNSRGLAHAQQNNLSDALADYNKAIDITSNFADAYINRGNIFLEKGDFFAALSDFNKAIELIPLATNVSPYQVLDRQLQGELYDINSFSEIVMSLYSPENYAIARRLFERAVSIAEAIQGSSHPVTAASLSRLGSLLYAQGD